MRVSFTESLQQRSLTQKAMPGIKRQDFEFVTQYNIDGLFVWKSIHESPRASCQASPCGTLFAFVNSGNNGLTTRDRERIAAFHSLRVIWLIVIVIGARQASGLAASKSLSSSSHSSTSSLSSPPAPAVPQKAASHSTPHRSMTPHCRPRHRNKQSNSLCQ
jgi:hypothetical protein